MKKKIYLCRRKRRRKLNLMYHKTIIMKRLIKKFGLVAILAIGTASVMIACAKEDATSIDASTPKARPTIGQIAKLLGIKPEAIVKVQYRDGVYHKKETFHPNGTVASREVWCDKPYNVSCYTEVYVRVGTKSSTSDTASNGFIGIRSDNLGEPTSIVLIFDKNDLSDFAWIQNNVVHFHNDHPLVNLNLIDGFDNNKTVFVKKGSYHLTEQEGILYVDLPVSSLIVEDGITIAI